MDIRSRAASKEFAQGTRTGADGTLPRGTEGIIHLMKDRVRPSDEDVILAIDTSNASCELRGFGLRLQSRDELLKYMKSSEMEHIGLQCNRAKRCTFSYLRTIGNYTGM